MAAGEAPRSFASLRQRLVEGGVSCDLSEAASPFADRPVIWGISAGTRLGGILCCLSVDGAKERIHFAHVSDAKGVPFMTLAEASAHWGRIFPN